jgi:hypothetical protein
LADPARPPAIVSYDVFVCLKTGVEPTQEVDETSTVSYVAASGDTVGENVIMRNNSHNHQTNNRNAHTTQASAKDNDVDHNDQQSSPKSMSSVKTQQVILSSRQSSTSSQLPGPSQPLPTAGTGELVRLAGSDVAAPQQQLDATLSTSPPPPPVPPRPISRANNNSATLLRSNAMSAAAAARGGSRRGGGSRASRRPSNASPTSLLGSPQRANGTVTT